MAYAGNNHPRSLIRKVIYDSLVQFASQIGIPANDIYVGRYYAVDKRKLPCIYVETLDSQDTQDVASQGFVSHIRSLDAKIFIATDEEESQIDAIDACENLMRGCEIYTVSPNSNLNSQDSISEVSISSDKIVPAPDGQAMAQGELTLTIKYLDQLFNYEV